MYKGDVAPQVAYRALMDNEKSRLVDVRTPAEWTYVGVPDIDGMLMITWQPLAGSGFDPRFVEQMTRQLPDRTIPVYLICRSGIRSAHAAQALSMAGFTDCYNVAEGFEGDRDEHGHRGTIGGWKVAGLPWKQG